MAFSLTHRYSTHRPLVCVGVNSLSCEFIIPIQVKNRSYITARLSIYLFFACFCFCECCSVDVIVQLEYVTRRSRPNQFDQLE